MAQLTQLLPSNSKEFRSNNVPDEIKRALHEAVDAGNFSIEVTTHRDMSCYQNLTYITVHGLRLAMRTDIMQEHLLEKSGIGFLPDGMRERAKMIQEIQKPIKHVPNYNQLINDLEKELGPT